MRIGILCPTEKELAPVLKLLKVNSTEKHAMVHYHIGTYDDLEVVALYSGVCKVNAAIASQVLIDRFQVSRVILSGVAGGIDPKLKIGDSVIGTSYGYHDVDNGILTAYHPWMATPYFYHDPSYDKIIDHVVENWQEETLLMKGRIVTGEAFISSEGRERIIHAHDPLCVDMETTSVAHVCYANSVPFMAIRTMTDTEEYCGEATFEENLEFASMVSSKILKKVLDEIEDSCDYHNKTIPLK